MTEFPKDGVFPAITTQEKAALYSFRYDIYVTEMGRYGSIANHDAGHLIEPEDEQSRLYYVIRDGQVVGTMRNTWGGDAAFPACLFVPVLPQHSLQFPVHDCIAQPDF